MTSRTPDAPRIDGDRLLRRIEALATIGPIDGGGSCRLALTDEDREGRDLVVAWMHDLNLDVRVDGIGNVVGVRPGRTDGPPVMTGSHIDTVRTGGRYDGHLGVLAGLEVIETLAQQGLRPEHPFAVAFFTDEEGSRFPPTCWGVSSTSAGWPSRRPWTLWASTVRLSARNWNALATRARSPVLGRHPGPL